MTIEQIKKGDWMALMGIERNRPVKIVRIVADNEIIVRMPEGDLMPVNLSDLRKVGA